VTEAQRITQGSSAVDQMERENRDKREQLELTKKLNAENATAEERQRRMANLVEDQQIQGGRDSGALPRGDSPAAIAVREGERQALRDQTAARTAVADSEANQKTQITDANTIVDIMQKQHATLEQATKELERQKMLTAAIVEARRAGNEDEAKKLELQKGQTDETQRQINLINQQQQNTASLRRGALEMEYDRRIAAAPADQQWQLRANRELWLQTQTAGQMPEGGSGTGGAGTGGTGTGGAAAGGGSGPDTPGGPWINRPAAQPYLDMLRNAATANNLPVALLAELIGQESQFRNIHNVPFVNAAGQVVGSSASGLGQQIAGNVHLHGGDPMDQATSIAATAEEFAERLRGDGNHRGECPPSPWRPGSRHEVRGA
jgi:hypothetical protein